MIAVSATGPSTDPLSSQRLAERREELADLFESGESSLGFEHPRRGRGTKERFNLAGYFPHERFGDLADVDSVVVRLLGQGRCVVVTDPRSERSAHREA